VLTFALDERGRVKSGFDGHERLETTCSYYLGMLDNNALTRAHERFLGW